MKTKFPRLYKYRSLAEGVARDRTLQILEKNELWYAKASGFNDPFDCNFQIALKTDQEWSAAIRSRYHSALKKMTV